MADGGADVIKVEPLRGDDARSNGTRISATEARQYLNKNRGKRSLSVKIDDPETLKAVQELVRNADVLISNFRPGQGEKLGLHYDEVIKTNPGIIYAENSAFGSEGPLAGRPGMDALLQGHTGIATMGDGEPDLLTDPIIDYTAALLMAWGIASALYHRERSGEGQKLDVSLLQAALVIQNNSVNHVDAVDEWRLEFVDYLKEAFARGDSLQDVLKHRDGVKPVINPPYYGIFETSDGLLALAAAGPATRERAAKVLQIDDPLVQDPGFVPDDLNAFIVEMRAKVQARLRTNTTGHWMAAFDEAVVAAGTVQLKDQVLDDEQSWANDYLIRLEHEEIGGMTVVGPPVKFSATPLEVKSPSPPLGRHSREILAEAGVSEAQIAALIDKGVVISWK